MIVELFWGSKDKYLGMKRAFILIVALFLFGSGYSLIAQDILILKSGKELKVNIVEDGTEVVKYREFDNPAGPLYSVTKDKVASIKYKKGATDGQDIKVDVSVKERYGVQETATQPGSLPLLSVKKRYVLLDGKTQSTRQVRTIMEDHPEALSLYESGKKLCNLSNSCAFGVMLTSFITSQIVNKKVDSEDKIKAGIPGLAIDGALIIAAIIMSSTGKSKIKKSVSMYNSVISKPVSYKLNFGIQENGIGLALKF